VFAPTSNVTVPDPLPLAPAATVIHGAVLAAVHVQPVVVVTLTDRPVVAVDAAAIVSGLTANEQGAGWVTVPGCVTVTACPATSIVPVLEPPLFAATPKVTLPLPVPLAPAVIVIHAAVLVAVQPHDAVVETAINTPVLPPTGAVIVVGFAVNAQFVAPA